jgi:glucose-6-phosphate 1-dehydrogenase
MQLLALTLMDIPKNFEWGKMPELRSEALRQLQPIDPSQVIRAQYEGYRDEANNPKSNVETFVSLKLVSNQPSWFGVPITLTTGKALAETKTEMRINLKMKDGTESNCLIFRIQPNEGIDIELFVKKPGYNLAFETRHLSFNYPADTKLPDAYEQVIVDAISSQKSLFTSSGEVLRSWQILQPVQDDWNKTSAAPKLYPVGADIRSILG